MFNLMHQNSLTLRLVQLNFTAEMALDDCDVDVMLCVEDGIYQQLHEYIKLAITNQERRKHKE